MRKVRPFPFFLLLDGAPAPLVSLIGQKQYKRCARDIYFFLQVTSISHWHMLHA